MFGFFKSAAYRADCSSVIQDIVLKQVNIGKQSCVEFVEDHKVFFDQSKENGFEPGAAVMFVTQNVLLAIANGSHEQIRSFNNCQHTEIICMIFGNLILTLMEDGEEKESIQKAIITIENRINSDFDAIAEAVPGLREKLHGKD